MKSLQLDESPRRRPGKPGPGQLQVTDWEPPELLRLRGALALLRFESYGSGGSPGLRDRASGGSSEWSMPDPNQWRSKRRKDLGRLLEGFDRLAADIVRAVAWKIEISPRCKKCKTDVSAMANYCHRCGARVPRVDPEVTDHG